jgi:hypothetical protein
MTGTVAVTGQGPDRYDRLGVGYQQTRREEPRLVARIHTTTTPRR